MRKSFTALAISWLVALVLVVSTVNCADTTPASSPAIDAIAAEISAGLGTVKETHTGRKGPVMIFDETHTSRIGQIEIAHMLTRLYKHHDLRDIALEGAIKSRDQMDTQWANKLGSGRRIDIAAGLLREGEISSAEFMAIAMPDIRVQGIDDAELYAVDLADGEGAATTLYLVAIAEGSLSDSEIAKVNTLVEADRVKDAVDLIINADSWTKKAYKALQQHCPAPSIENMLRQVERIEDRARSRGISIDRDLAKNMAGLKRFYKAASDRSNSMVDQTLAIAEQAKGTPIGMVIGAAHTEAVMKRFRSAGCSFAVISPLAIANCDTINDLSYEAFERKSLGQSTDPPGALGAILDARRKPKPVVDQPWLPRKANVYYIVSEVAQAVAYGDTRPYATLPDFTTLDGVRFDPTNIRLDGNEVIFPMDVQDAKDKWRTIWVRAAYNEGVTAAGSDKTLDEHIDALLEEAGGGNGRGDDGSGGITEPGDEGRLGLAPNTRRISKNVYARISSDSSATQKTIFIGV